MKNLAELNLDARGTYNVHLSEYNRIWENKMWHLSESRPFKLRGNLSRKEAAFLGSCFGCVKSVSFPSASGFSLRLWELSQSWWLQVGERQWGYQTCLSTWSDCTDVAGSSQPKKKCTCHTSASALQRWMELHWRQEKIIAISVRFGTLRWKSNEFPRASSSTLPSGLCQSGVISWHKHVCTFLVQGTRCFLETGQNSSCGIRVAKGQAVIMGSPFSDDWGQVSILRLGW